MVSSLPALLREHAVSDVRVCPQRTQAVLQAVSAVQSGGSPSSDVQEALAAASSPVLRIIIDNMFYPVTLDVLQQVECTAAHSCTV